MGYKKTEWKKIKLSDAAFESAGVFDVNNNGVLDIVSGEYWYEGPDFKTRHKICSLEPQGEYFDDFSTIPMDINGDGYLDFVTGGWWGGHLYWRENPKGQTGEWTTHVIAEVGNIETTRGWDVDGDGEIEICPNTPGRPLSFFKLIRDAQGKGTGQFRQIQVGTEPSGHGLGFGDVNGDGRGDFIVCNGWWEAPADPLNQPWTFHQEFDLGMASVPMVVVDFNGDGLAEIIVGQAHGYGLDYLQQHIAADGARSWTRHPIDPYFSQYHDMIWCDIDGDGECELVTGNRYRAHCGNDPGETDTCGLYFFKWNGESFTKQIIDHGSVGAHSGTGIYMTICKLNGGERLDIIAPGKEGLYLFKNLGPEGKSE